jgi:pimeloyl-ACP methyl ester carboxylesterase
VSGDFEARQIILHGHRVIYRRTGDGPPLVLIHGMINSSRHWAKVADRLAADYTVIAPDLIGHGESSTPRGDYSLGAHAASIRDLLTTIGIERATIAGHSLGGGVAMQFFYQFPQRTERLILISSGGLGREVSPMLRGAALPGAGIGLSLAANRLVIGALSLATWLLKRAGSDLGRQTEAIARALKPLSPPGARRAFLETLRSVIDIRGQKVSATDRLHLLETTPTLIVWGERDNTIPILHGADSHAAIPHSSFETLPRAAHFPNLEDPEGLAAAIAAFLAETEPAPVLDGRWGSLVENENRGRG